MFYDEDEDKDDNLTLIKTDDEEENMFF